MVVLAMVTMDSQQHIGILPLHHIPVAFAFSVSVTVFDSMGETVGVGVGEEAWVYDFR